MITAWSYSRWKDHAICPLKAKLKHVDKLREPANAAMLRGSAVHKAGEDFLNGVRKDIDPVYATFADELKKLKRKKAVAEEKWTFTDTWGETSWFADDAWCRMGIDAYTITKKTMRLVDYKTGKVREENEEQLGLYALGAFTRFPELKEVATEFWYLDQAVPVQLHFLAKDKEPLRELWERKTWALLHDTIFPPRPGGHCRWCHFRKANGGPCQF